MGCVLGGIVLELVVVEERNLDILGGMRFRNQEHFASLEGGAFLLRLSD